jgi:arsenate reductase (glutaredoxin)
MHPSAPRPCPSICLWYPLVFPSLQEQCRLNLAPRRGRFVVHAKRIMKKTLYGIPNCDTVKKARTWLADQGHAFDFHDFKKQGLERATAAQWLTQIDWQTLVNRKGTTWRNLPDERKAAVTDNASALDLILESPSVVKRPVLDRGGKFSVGFSDSQYQDLFK